MELKFKFDNSVLEKYKNRDSEPFFFIWFEHDGKVYPDEEWMDFGFTIISWWINNLLQILMGIKEEGEWDFMDGPFSFNIKYEKSNRVIEMIPEGENYIWNIDIIELAEELARAFNNIAREMFSFGFYGDMEKDHVNRFLNKFRNELKNFKEKK